MEREETKQEHLIRDIPLTKAPEIITINESESVAKALKLLRKNQIRSLGVCDDSGELIGLVTAFDIMTYICFGAYQYDQVPEDNIDAGKSLNTRIGDITSVFHEETSKIWYFKETDPITALYDPLSLGYHQGVVITEKGKKKVITQHDLVKYFCSQLFTGDMPKNPIEESPKRLDELGFGNPDKPFKTRCCSVDTTRSALFAFRRMELEGYSALPVVDEKGSVVATISSSDVRDIPTEEIKVVLLPVLEFLKKVHGEVPPPLTCRTDVTLISVMNTLVNLHHRHMWIVTPKGEHIDTISLSDIIAFPARRQVIGENNSYIC